MGQCPLVKSFFYSLAPHCLLHDACSHLRQVEQVAPCAALCHYHGVRPLVCIICDCPSCFVSRLVQDFQNAELQRFLHCFSRKCFKLSLLELRNQSVHVSFGCIKVFPYFHFCGLRKVGVRQCRCKSGSQQILNAEPENLAEQVDIGVLSVFLMKAPQHQAGL